MSEPVTRSTENDRTQAMIVSHSRQFIFFAVPKTATQSIRTALSAHLQESDWQQHALFGHARSPVPALAEIGHGHITVRELRPHIDDDAWSDYLKFAFVRNPYDRFVSVCTFLFRDDPTFEARSRDVMKTALGRGRFRRRVLVRPQVSMLQDETGDIAVDVLGRFETLQDCFDGICTRLGIETAVLERKNTSRRGSLAAYYDRELQEMVFDFYRADFEMLRYPEELPAVN